MAHIVVEFEFSTPIDDAAIERNVSVLRPCLEVRSIRKVGSVVSADHTRGSCLFEAPDAETVRELFRVGGVPFKSVWPAQFFDFYLPSQRWMVKGREVEAMAYLVVEYEFSPPLTDEALQRASSVLGPCLEVRNVKKLRTVLSADRTRGFCLFEAADAETLREAYRSARVPFKSVWPAQIFDFAAPSPG